jgi:hypothetical protein
MVLFVYNWKRTDWIMRIHSTVATTSDLVLKNPYLLPQDENSSFTLLPFPPGVMYMPDGPNCDVM